MEYRKDIDGLRALAIIFVILFHLGYLTNGYLGVDVFLVISGFLITSIIYKSAQKEEFSILNFYERRIRRIIPLLLFICFIALIMGIILMLPEDLENLAQSVISSNFSINNILMYITSGNYWSTKNEFKPLMHTWSLGVEEHFYLIYPFIFYFFQGRKIKMAIYLIVMLTLASLIAFFVQDNASSKFYLIQYRFYELSIGGLGAIFIYNFNPIKAKFHISCLYVSIGVTLFLLCIPILSLKPFYNIIITLSTLGILMTGSQYLSSAGLYSKLFTNPIVVGIGKISFSLYMWHQIVFAFARYTIMQDVTIIWSVVLTMITVLLSIFTYFLVENTFRNHILVKSKYVLLACGLLLLITTIGAFYIHSINGIIKEYPELGLSNQVFKKNFFTSNRNGCIKYIDDINALNKDFTNKDNLKVLVIGNSFGRDVSNILLEYDLQSMLEVRYFNIDNLYDTLLRKRVIEADRIIFAAKNFIGKDTLIFLQKIHKIPIPNSKIWVFGTKDFGYHNGIHHFRYSQKMDFLTYRTNMKKGVNEINQRLKLEWSDKYIDLISFLSDNNGRVLVYTPDGRFISHDTLHLTKYGAVYFATILENELNEIFGLYN